MRIKARWILYRMNNRIAILLGIYTSVALAAMICAIFLSLLRVPVWMVVGSILFWAAWAAVAQALLPQIGNMKWTPLVRDFKGAFTYYRLTVWALFWPFRAIPQKLSGVLRDGGKRLRKSVEEEALHQLQSLSGERL